MVGGAAHNLRADVRVQLRMVEREKKGPWAQLILGMRGSGGSPGKAAKAPGHEGTARSPRDVHLSP